MNEFYAGAISGIINVIIGHPLDTIKVQQQCHSYGLRNCITYIYRNYGVFGFYKGIYPPLISISLQNAIVFSSYNYAKKYLNNINPNYHSLNYILAGAYAGILCASVSTPTDLIKIKLQTGNKYSFNLNGIYKGFAITAVRDSTAFATQFVVYENIKLKISNYNNNLYAASMIAGGISGVITWYASYIPDILKTHIQKSETKLSIYNAYKFITANYGYRGLYRGIMPCIIRVIFVDSICFPVYEYTRLIFTL